MAGLPLRNVHNPGLLFRDAETRSKDAQSVLVVLDQPIRCTKAFQRCYDNAHWRIYADGGANRVRQLEKSLRKNLPPHVIIGDLDSLNSATRDHYLSQSKPVVICQNPDQYSTDFGKAISCARFLQQWFTSEDDLFQCVDADPAADLHGVTKSEVLDAAIYGRQKVSRSECQTEVVVFGGIGGRLDHGIGLLSNLLTEDKANPDLRFWLVSERSVTWILAPSRDIGSQQSSSGTSESDHAIQLSPPADSSSDTNRGFFTENAGILPVFGPTSIWLKGFEWDVSDWQSEMGGQISSSNHVKSEDGVVRVGCTRETLFTIEMGAELLDEED